MNFSLLRRPPLLLAGHGIHTGRKPAQDVGRIDIQRDGREASEEWHSRAEAAANRRQPRPRNILYRDFYDVAGYVAAVRESYRRIQIGGRVIVDKNMLGAVAGGDNPHRVLLHDLFDGRILAEVARGLKGYSVAAALSYRVLQRAPAEQQQTEIDERENQREQRQHRENGFDNCVA